MNNITPFSSLSDEELLVHVFISKPVCTPLELELAARLEQLLDELETRPQGIGDFLLRQSIQREAKET